MINLNISKTLSFQEEDPSFSVVHATTMTKKKEVNYVLIGKILFFIFVFGFSIWWFLITLK
jgi:hypothetical protein